ncbi:MAG: hypothetical protein ING19_08905 [Azospirillum sp.]|nr:hypothetical protein [Azospirillum sp.]
MTLSSNARRIRRLFFRGAVRNLVRHRGLAGKRGDFFAVVNAGQTPFPEFLQLRIAAILDALDEFRLFQIRKTMVDFLLRRMQQVGQRFGKSVLDGAEAVEMRARRRTCDRFSAQLQNPARGRHEPAHVAAAMDAREIACILRIRRRFPGLPGNAVGFAEIEDRGLQIRDLVRVSQDGLFASVLVEFDVEKAPHLAQRIEIPGRSFDGLSDFFDEFSDAEQFFG